MTKMKRRDGTGVARRRNQLVKAHEIQDMQRQYRMEMLDGVEPGDIERWKAAVMKGIEKGDMKAARLFAEQILGPMKHEQQLEIVDVAAVLEVRQRELDRLRNEVSVDVDGEVVE